MKRVLLGVGLTASVAAAAVAQQMSVPAGLTLGSMSRVSPVLKAERTHENFEPAVIMPAQQRAAQAKLEAEFGGLLFRRGVLRDAPAPAAALARAARHGGKLHLARDLRALLGIVDLWQHPPVCYHGEGLARAHQAQRIVEGGRERTLLRAVVDVVGVERQRLGSLTLQQIDDLARRFGRRHHALPRIARKSGNTRLGNDYIFAGTAVDTPPYSATRDAGGNVTAVTYDGNNSQASIPLSDALTIKVRAKADSEIKDRCFVIALQESQKMNVR